MKVFSIASGSKGNCTFVKSDTTCILVDCGISIQKLAAAIERRGESVDDVCAVLITHEHGDHVRGLAMLVKRCPQIKIYAHKEVCRVVAIKEPILARFLSPIVSPLFYLKEFMISAFLLPHDSVACFGYGIYSADKKFSIATDIGTVTDNLIESIFDSDLVFIESNHSKKMLRDCQVYHSVLKARIAGAGGHLSNHDCAEVISAICERRKKNGQQDCNFVLCHLSENTNSSEVATQEVSKALAQNEQVCSFTIATQNGGSDIFEI